MLKCRTWSGIILGALLLVMASSLAVAQEPPKGLVPAPADTGNTQNVNVYILSIGVSKYANSQLDLRYADKDAEAIKNVFEGQKGLLFEQVKTRPLLNEQATKGAIIDGLDWIIGGLTEHDLAIIFISGHGAPNPRRQDDYYFLPYDADLNRLASTAIPWYEFEHAFENLAGKIVFFVDTCHAGGITGIKSVPSELTAKQDFVSAGQGIIYITSSMKNELAREDPAWGHGAFTKAVLDGLSGDADRNEDCVIYTSELYDYISERLKYLTNKGQNATIKTSTQYTTFPLFILSCPEPPEPTAIPEVTSTSVPPTPDTRSVKLNGHIAYFVFNPDQSKPTYNVYNANVDGTDVRLFWEWARQPRFRRPDGCLILNADGQGRDSLWAVNMDGSNAREASRHPEDSRPSWSPNGKGIVFDSEFRLIGGRSTIWRQNSVDEISEPIPVTFNGEVIQGHSPVWLADDWVVYNGCKPYEGMSDCGLYKIPSWGDNQPIRLTQGACDRATDSFSELVVYMSCLGGDSACQGGNWEIFTMRSDGGNAKNLTNNPAQDALPAFSPDGSMIAFVSNRSGARALWAMNADGSAPRKLFDLPDGAMGNEWINERISWGP